ncbi:MAG: division/cell wall cluster transcriptional repressor MraZ [Anaerolineaceae bacterium]
MALLGTFEHVLDDKKRVAIPARWRDQFDAPAYLTSSEEKCVAVYTKSDFDAASAEILAVPASTRQGRDARRKFFGDTRDVAKDAQGRLGIPQTLIDHAGLKQDVVLIGNFEWFEIWDKETWVQYNAAGAGE